MKRIVLLSVIAAGLMAQAVPAQAHPLGNFTTNVHLGIDVSDRSLSVLLVVDMAEIPTFRETLDVDGDGDISDDDLDSYADASCARHGTTIELTDAGHELALESGATRAALAPGSGGLPTLRLECHYETTSTGRAGTVEVVNRVHDDRTGWAEIVVRGADAEGALPESRSATLTAYPEGTPLDQRSATILLGAPAPVSISESGPDRPPVTGWLGSLAEGGGMVAIAAALGLGVTHALAPGHGKTLMAAYLVGRRGTARHAAGLGLATAISHTLGVAVLGLVTATASSRFQPETVYPWLTTISAGAVTTVGAILLFKALTSRGHRHGHGDHGHGDHDHHHHHALDRSNTEVVGWRSLATLGLAGGLVPSASAVVLLLGAAAIGRPWFGLMLVMAFGVGMSIALVTVGIAALRVSEASLRRLGRSRNLVVQPKLVSAFAGTAVTGFGVLLLWDAMRAFAG